MTRSWKTTIGGALSALGKTLMGIGIVPQLAGVPNQLLTYTAVLGFALDAVGGFLGHLFAADETTVIKMLKAVGADTSVLERK